MQKKSRHTFKLLLLLFVLISASCKENTEPAPALSNGVITTSVSKEDRVAMVTEGNQCPNGSLKKIDNSIVEINSFRGKYVIIDFWATWCAPCLKEAPLFKKIAEKYKTENAAFISISVDENIDDWKHYVSENKWTGNNYWFGMQEDEPFFSLVYSKHTLENKEMVLIGLPKYVIIDPNGKILSNADLRPSKPEFEEMLKQVFK